MVGAFAAQIRRDAAPSLAVVVNALPPAVAGFVRKVADLLGLGLSLVLLVAAGRACMDLLQQRSPETKFDPNVSKYVDERLMDELEKEGFFKRMGGKS